MLTRISKHKRSLLEIAVLVAVFGLWNVTTASADSNVTAPQTTSIVALAQDDLALCKAKLAVATDSFNAFLAQHCIDADNAVIAKNGGTPTPSPSTSPTPSPSASPSPTATLPSPTPSPSQSPTPTPTPTPSPTVSSDCVPTTTIPSGFPTNCTAGIPPNTILLPWGGGTSGTDNRSGTAGAPLVYDSVQIPKSVSGGWTFTGSNLTFRNCSFATDVLFSRGSNIRIEHCNINGGTSFSATANVVLDSNNIFNWDDGIHITADDCTGVVSQKNCSKQFTIRNNYVHAPIGSTTIVNGRSADVPCSLHMDAVQLLGVIGISITDNSFDLGPWYQCSQGTDVLNSVFQIENTQGPDTNVTINHNYINGGGYAARFYQCSNSTFTNNIFGLNAIYGPVTATCIPPGSWSMNFDINNRPINDPAG